MDFNCAKAKRVKGDIETYKKYTIEVYKEIDRNLGYFYDIFILKSRPLKNEIESFHLFLNKLVEISECLNIDMFRPKLYEIVETLNVNYDINKPKVIFKLIKFHSTNTEENQILVGDYAKKVGMWRNCPTLKEYQCNDECYFEKERGMLQKLYRNGRCKSLNIKDLVVRSYCSENSYRSIEEIIAIINMFKNRKGKVLKSTERRYLCRKLSKTFDKNLQIFGEMSQDNQSNFWNNMRMDNLDIYKALRIVDGSTKRDFSFKETSDILYNWLRKKKWILITVIGLIMSAILLYTYRPEYFDISYFTSPSLITPDGIPPIPPPIPNLNGTIPNLNGTIPNLNGTTPTLIGPLPNLNGTTPTLIGPLPNLNGTTPTLIGPLPNLNGTTPTLIGPLPNLNETIPNLNGTIPNLNGTIPNLNEAIPNLNGISPNEIIPNETTSIMNEIVTDGTNVDSFVESITGVKDIVDRNVTASDGVDIELLKRFGIDLREAAGDDGIIDLEEYKEVIAPFINKFTELPNVLQANVPALPGDKYDKILDSFNKLSSKIAEGTATSKDITAFNRLKSTIAAFRFQDINKTDYVPPDQIMKELGATIKGKMLEISKLTNQPGMVPIYNVASDELYLEKVTNLAKAHLTGKIPELTTTAIPVIKETINGVEFYYLTDPENTLARVQALAKIAKDAEIPVIETQLPDGMSIGNFISYLWRGATGSLEVPYKPRQFS